MNKKTNGQEEAAVETTAADKAEDLGKREDRAAPAKKTRRAAEAKRSGTQVYCGPTVRGVAKQYTVYAGGIPAELEDFIRRHPEAAVLVVPVEKFAQTRKRMETAGTAEAMVYRKIKSEL